MRKLSRQIKIEVRDTIWQGVREEATTKAHFGFTNWWGIWRKINQPIWDSSRVKTN